MNVYSDLKQLTSRVKPWAAIPLLALLVGAYQLGAGEAYELCLKKDAKAGMTQSGSGTFSYQPAYIGRNVTATLTDHTTGLIWAEPDSAALATGLKGDGKLSWTEAKEWCSQARFGGYSNWRLPTTSELQAIADQNHPQAAAFNVAYQGDVNSWPYYWSDDNAPDAATYAAYVSFNQEVEYVEFPPESGQFEVLHIHPAGSANRVKHAVLGPRQPQNRARCVRDNQGERQTQVLKTAYNKQSYEW